LNFIKLSCIYYLYRGFGLCGTCGNSMSLVQSTNGRFVVCESCSVNYILPKNGEITVLDKLCPLCNFSVMVIDGKSNFKVCPKCYNSPPPDMSIRDESSNSFMPCFKCQNAGCEFSNQQSKNMKLFPCPKCGKSVTLRRLKTQSMVCSCEGYPNCKNSAFVPDIFENVI
jgi:ssDNA-binding Zn-finger/Zn-ribbon topoisomerase 1